jgi:hypothetical protein
LLADEILMGMFIQGILTEGGRLGTVDHLIKVVCFVKKVNNILIKKELI